MCISDLIEKTKLYTTQNSVDAILYLSILAKQILDDIAREIQPGISESQATEAAYLTFKNYCIDKLWHQPFIRFNQNTLCTFKDRSMKDYILQEEDIAFIDIGIVKDGIEGDVGKTIVFGCNKEFIRLKDVSEILFQDAITYWRADNPTGIKLYEFIYAQSKKHNVLFNLSPAGHLIGAFPHTHAWTKGANTYPDKLVSKGWILEIQIKSLTQPFGAFYEGLLV
ncbi:MAG: M24 family metallopeptidase [Gammaproteobacteria bacterium]|nr:M24 family metallopeptidase [Gammaproteobacteria bacterium]MCW5582406.1 M24 family metallopeptidase [Gammaproteobacteria bacterium]